MPGRNGYSGGPGERRIVIDPRRRQLTDGDPIQAPPPSLLGDEDDPGLYPTPYRWSKEILTQGPSPYPDDGLDPVRETLRLRVRPGHPFSRTARVRIYHRLHGAPEAGLEGRCWAFTISRAAYDRLVSERVLDSDGATWPNGERIVPPDVDPLYVPIRCGSCGTQRVECLQMECWQE